MSEHVDAVASVYARSLYELASEAGGAAKIAEVADELEAICEIARGDRRFREFLASPIVDQTRRSATLQRIFKDRVTDLVVRFLLVLNDKGRLAHLESINVALDRLVQESQGRVEVDVYTPAPLGDEQKRIVADRVRAALGKDPVLHAYADPHMIGGIKLRIGDRLIDGSIATRLRRMRQNVLESGQSEMRAKAARILGENA